MVWQNSLENICLGVSFLIKSQALDLRFYWKNNPAQEFSCEFNEIFKHTFLQNISGQLLLYRYNNARKEYYWARLQALSSKIL